ALDSPGAARLEFERLVKPAGQARAHGGDRGGRAGRDAAPRGSGPGRDEGKDPRRRLPPPRDRGLCGPQHARDRAGRGRQPRPHQLPLPLQGPAGHRGPRPGQPPAPRAPAAHVPQPRQLRREVGGGPALLRERSGVGLRARAGRALGREPREPGAAREVPAAPARVEAARAPGRGRGARDPEGRRGRAAAAFHRGGHRVLDLGVLARDGVFRSPRRPRGPGRAQGRTRRDAEAPRGPGRARPAAGRRRESQTEKGMSAKPERLRAVVGPLAEGGRLPDGDPYPFGTVTPVREGYVERDGVRCWYGVWGEQGPWIAFAPIFQITHVRILKATVPYLSRHFRVLAMDGRGNGRSDRPQGQEHYS